MEGGNEQLEHFFMRHSLESLGARGQANVNKRYFTKAARFYQTGMHRHVKKVIAIGRWRGRDASRMCTPT